MFKPETARKGRIYCSQECRSKRYVIYREKSDGEKRKLEDRICEVCGSKYTATSPIQKTCSHDCYLERRRLRRKEKSGVLNLEPRKCANDGCDKVFQPSKRTHIYCSRECAVRSQIEHQRDIAKPKPRKKSEYTINEYYCYRCKVKVNGKMKEETKGKNKITSVYCPKCGELIYTNGSMQSVLYKIQPSEEKVEVEEHA